MLQMASAKGFDETISWMPDGRSFRVHDQEKFEQNIQPRFFGAKSYRSFQRQLNLYHFEGEGRYTGES